MVPLLSEFHRALGTCESLARIWPPLVHLMPHTLVCLLVGGERWTELSPSRILPCFSGQSGFQPPVRAEATQLH